MKDRMRLGAFLGVPVYVHVSWPLVLGLVVFLLATGAAANPYAEDGGAILWLTSLGIATGIFLSVLCHEVAHLAAATRYHLPVRRVTLYPFGGVPLLARSFTTRRAGLIHAAAGPAGSVLIGLFLLAAAGYLDAGLALSWLGLFNLGLGLVNLLPAVPLDGPRLWQSLALRPSSVLYLHLFSYVAGKLVAVGLIWAGGGASLVSRSPDGLLLVLVGALMLWADDGRRESRRPRRLNSSRALPEAHGRQNGHGPAGVFVGTPTRQKRSERRIDGI